MRASVQACVLLARYLTNQWTEFHQTLVDDVVEATDELARFEGRRVKVKVATRLDVQNVGTPYLGLLNSSNDHNQS